VKERAVRGFTGGKQLEDPFTWRISAHSAEISGWGTSCANLFCSYL